ncbi:MAG: 30S ribosomal protein S7 [Planctomycetota bacterium]|jgi:small subunit ribosomal protein S7|nr:30S ribosomal protein S7 [Planctomycetota bacterium]
MSVKSTNVTGPGVKPDAKFSSPLAAKFINCLMHDGKKSTSEAIFYQAMDIIAKKLPDEQPIKVFETAINNVKPMVEVKSRRVGGANYQVPIQVKPNRQQSLAIRWVLEASRKKKGKAMSDRLAGEFMDAFKREGAAMTVRENTHRMAEANKAFAHFAW